MCVEAKAVLEVIACDNVSSQKLEKPQTGRQNQLFFFGGGGGGGFRIKVMAKLHQATKRDINIIPRMHHVDDSLICPYIRGMS